MLRVSFRQNLARKGEEICREGKRFSVEQMVAVLKQAEVGVPVVEVCRQVGITEQTFYRWKKQYVELERGVHPGLSVHLQSNSRRWLHRASPRKRHQMRHLCD